LFEKKEAVYTEETSNFGEVGFKAICNEKPFLVLEVVKLGFNVLWTDSDILFRVRSRRERLPDIMTKSKYSVAG
jgi:hypothetical protein